ncbi:AAA family ATPase [Streptomyces griseocarneus]|uniref:AAA family ATPase n=1 Tax=Streptomyces griseocarneus TaxID=51201 RepID=UPI00167D4349|nr:AAA family ATPase [Streptomyces griseocarneus]MBZ6477751.1 AAA family ATPase [Streptomyces griseocarneus]GHG61271.1 ATPase AAA [Streptomyces griseocarneus]
MNAHDKERDEGGPGVRGRGGHTLPDRGDGAVYVMSQEIELVVKVARATGRPLLLRGRPGSGKSSLALYLAQANRWRYYEHVVTQRTHPQDPLWTYDSVRRLSDAQLLSTRPGNARLDDAAYVRPGALWWALAPESARRRGREAGHGPDETCREPFQEINADRRGRPAVVLIDEIDKADPDVPNSLLVPLGAHRFTVTETGAGIHAEEEQDEARLFRHLVVITTNEERELPQAFLRRCVVLTLPDHDEQTLVRIAVRHLRHWYGAVLPEHRTLASALARELGTVRAEAGQFGLRPPSTAEYLDALRACITLGIDVSDPEWEWLKHCALLKRQQVAGEEW